ncbi:hypothetical protein D3C76_491600 [compost metagenome]|nr:MULTISPECIES: membrane protein [Pseudomonas]KEY89965.1 membrane protein [Pseudomonas capeferrum]MCH7300967.1 hypothetical protein [Pseudomonas capeferrum]MDD2065918.1 hypothetical protein [Pseudomonas sp. 25571]
MKDLRFPIRQWPSLVMLVCLAALLIGSLFFGQWPDYTQMTATLDQPLSRLRWIVGDISEVAFYKHELPALGLLLGACLAHWAYVRGYRWQGFAICYGNGLWPWVFTSSLLSLLLSHLLWGWTLAGGDWQPTFVAFVSLPAAMVLLFGGGWQVTISGAVLGALLVTPASLLLVNYVCVPLGLPVLIGNVSGMAAASVAAFMMCKRFPSWVKLGQRPNGLQAVCIQPDYGVVWVLRRVLADFSEAPFFGNELASLGLLLGLLLAYVIAPAAPAYGSQMVVQMVAGQALASLVGVLVWRRQWQARGWYPTYIPIVSIVPVAVLTHGGDWQVVVISAVLGALLSPPLATAISERLPSHVHGYIGNVLSMAISTLAIVPLVGLIAEGGV